MKKLLMLIPLVFLCCLGCQQGERVLVERKADVEADIQAIRNITDKWQIAINAGDLDTLMSFYSDDAVKIPPNEPAVAGKEAIRRGYKKLFEENVRQEIHVIADIKISGDLAVTNTTWTLPNAPETAEGSSKPTGNWIRIFRKQPDGSWKIIYMMWSDESLIDQKIIVPAFAGGVRQANLPVPCRQEDLTVISLYLTSACVFRLQANRRIAQTGI